MESTKTVDCLHVETKPDDVRRPLISTHPVYLLYSPATHHHSYTIKKYPIHRRERTTTMRFSSLALLAVTATSVTSFVPRAFVGHAAVPTKSVIFSSAATETKETFQFEVRVFCTSGRDERATWIVCIHSIIPMTGTSSFPTHTKIIV